MGYKLWDPESQKVIRSNDVYFNEAKFHAKLEKVKEIRRVFLVKLDLSLVNKLMYQIEYMFQKENLLWF